FFFSSRRRHTIFSRDWSSDVCSSDLDQKVALAAAIAANDRQAARHRLEENETESLVIARRDVEVRDREQLVLRHVVHGSVKPYKIGRATCRERKSNVQVTTERKESET